MSQYDILPRSSFDAETKDRPRIRHWPSIFALLRKTRRACRPLYVLIGICVFLLWQVTFNASYTTPPPFTIPPNETVFVAANIIDADLMTGPWGASIEALVHLVGKDRVFVSIYGGPPTALAELDSRLSCNRSLVAEEKDPIALKDIPHTLLPTGEQRIKRIAYLAEVRNKALEPLEKLKTRFDKILFVNDVFLDPMDAARLLWGTNLNENGKSEYKAVCGADFVTSWKYYDTFATRDSEGYSIGVPIFPWFGNEGNAISRKDVLAGRDAVRVKSCWGGMTAFDAKYFTPRGMEVSQAPGITTQLPSLPLRFRSEPEPFWDSSECCLIHADIMSLPDLSMPTSEDDTGIYMNPYVRVAYDARSFANIKYAKRFERLFAPLQAIITPLAHLPRFNVRRTEKEGEVIKDRLWVSTKQQVTNALDKRATLGSEGSWGDWENRGHYEDSNRTANRGGYCGVRQLLVLKEGQLEEGEGNWDNLLSEVPPLEG